MPRPTNKEALISLSNLNYKKLMDYVNSLPEAEKSKEFPPQFMNRKISDVLAHLHHWHLLMLRWYKEGMRGGKPAMPEAGYTWKEIPRLNIDIREIYKDVSLRKIISLLDKSFRDLQIIMESNSNEELFEKKKYKWTGTTSLGVYLVSATSSHYDWALHLLKKAKKY